MYVILVRVDISLKVCLRLDVRDHYARFYRVIIVRIGRRGGICLLERGRRRFFGVMDDLWLSRLSYLLFEQRPYILLLLLKI